MQDINEMTGNTGLVSLPQNEGDYLVEKTETLVMLQLFNHLPLRPSKFLDLVIAKIDNYLQADYKTGKTLTPEEQAAKQERQMVVDIGGPGHEGELERALGVTTGKSLDKDDIKAILNFLDERVDTDPDSSEHGTGIRLFGDWEYWLVNGHWHIKLPITPKAAELIFIKNKVRFLKYALKEISGLKKKYAYRLYLYAELNRYHHLTWTVSVDYLRNLLGCPDYTKDWRKFNQDILGPAIAELNAKTNCKIQWSNDSGTKKTTHIRFELEPRYDLEPERRQANKMLASYGSGSQDISEENQMIVMRMRSDIINLLIEKINDQALITCYKTLDRYGRFEEKREDGIETDKFEYFCKVIDNILDSTEDKIDTIENINGYLINAVRCYCKEGANNV